MKINFLFHAHGNSIDLTMVHASIEELNILYDITIHKILILCLSVAHFFLAASLSRLSSYWK